MINKLLRRVVPSVLKSNTGVLNAPAYIRQHGSTNILSTLHAQAARPFSATVPTQYVSPYHIPAPLPFMVLYNRSPYAMQTAEDALKDAWSGSMRTIHVVQAGREHALGADFVVEVEKFNCIDHFMQQFQKLAAKHPVLRAAMKAHKVGFYDVWSAQGENPVWARDVMEKGFVRIGASPDKMAMLDKINLKRLCQKLGVPTAHFVEIEAEPNQDKALALQSMAERVLEIYRLDPKFRGKTVFLKRVNGGGGRGTIELANISDLEQALAALTRIVNDTGGDIGGVYIELSLGKGRRMLQLEVECDGANRIEDAVRVVFFNPYFQKVSEYGCTRKSVQQFIPVEIYDASLMAAKQLIESTGYDNRGTIEFLISLDEDGHWTFNVSEVNMRRQVEAPAIEGLVIDAEGRARNTTAEQVMRSCGFPAPSTEDFRPSGVEYIGHMRLGCVDVTEKGLNVPSNAQIDGAFIPHGVDVFYVKGRVYPDGDIQRGRALIYAQTWQACCDEQLRFAQEFQFYGPNTTNNYCQLYGKLALDPRFRAGQLGCNETFSVLAHPPIMKGKIQRIIDNLAFTVTPLITNGYRPKEGVKNRQHPTPVQFQAFKQLKASLLFQTVAETPFSRFLVHQNYDKFISDLLAQLEQHGGGTVSVIRDVLQSLFDQEAALIQKTLTQLLEVHGARSGIIVGNEEGGAQFQAAEMRTFMWLAVLLAGNPTNLSVHSLMRSIFMNGLSIKSMAKQKFVAKVLHDILQEAYGWEARETAVPWEPNNFHAGNHVQADMTTQIFLEAGIPVVPNFAWDPRNTSEQFKGWVVRQIELFQKLGKPLYRIRIKNPGQGPQWNADVVEAMVNIILATFKEHGMLRPIVHIHNHNFNGLAAHIAAEVFRRFQRAGYNGLIIDSVPHGLSSHNSNYIVADALRMTPEEREHLVAYNEGVHTTLNLLSRFNNQDITSVIQDPFSRWAGGTNSSDIADAIKMGIPLQQIPAALNLAVDLFGLGTPVTPYSEAMKQAIYAIFIQKDIQPKSIDAVHAYLKKGGKLAISDEILYWFSAWRTLLPRPQVVERLLLNHGIPLHSEHDTMILDEPLDVEADRKMLQSLLPNTLVTDVELMTYYMFDKIGLTALQHRDHSKLAAGPRNMTVMMDAPEFVYDPNKKVGDSFVIEGEKVTIVAMQPNLDTGMIDISFELQGHIVRTTGINPQAQATAAVKQVPMVKDPKKESGAPMASKLLLFKVKPGDKVRAGQTVAVVEAMKMEQHIKAPEGDDEDLTVAAIHGETNDIVAQDQLLVSYKR